MTGKKQVLDTLLEHHVAGIVLSSSEQYLEADLQRYANSSTLKSRCVLWIGNNCPSITLAWTATQVYGSDGISHSTRAQRYRVLLVLTHHMRYQGYLEAMNHHGLQPRY